MKKLKNEIKDVLYKKYTLNCGRKIKNIEVVSIINRRLSIVYVLKIRFYEKSSVDFICVKQYLNGFVKEKIYKEFINTKYIFEGVSEKIDLIIPESLFYDIEEGIVATSYVSNSFTYEKIINPISILLNNDHSEICHSLGVKLALFHDTVRTNVVPESNLLEMSSLGKYLSLRVSLVNDYILSVYGGKFSRFFVEEIAKKLDLFLENNIDHKDKPVFTHSDFTPANILLCNDDFAFIDFSESKLSSKYMDIASFCNYFYMLKLNYQIYNKNKIDEMIESFKRGYGSKSSFRKDSLRIYLLRYLLTNTLTNIYQFENNPLKRRIFKPRIYRYIRELINITH